MADVKNYDDTCLFCRILKGDIPSNKVYEDDDCYAFHDIAPQMPTHILVIPKTHIPSMAEVDADNSAAVGKCFEAIATVARERNLSDGFRVISNCGVSAGQTVGHLHFHILAGGPMGAKLV